MRRDEQLNLKGAGARRQPAAARCLGLLLLCAASLAAPCGAVKAHAQQRQQSGPDLNGTWAVEKEPRKNGSSRPVSDATLTLVISQRGPEIRMIHKTVHDGQERTRELVYYSDGRGETNLGPTISTGTGAEQDDEIKSKTVWRGDKLVIRARARKILAGHFVNWEMVEEWKLSANGQTLTKIDDIRLDNPDAGLVGTGPPGRPPARGQMIFVPAGPNKFRTVFHRVSD